MAVTLTTQELKQGSAGFLLRLDFEIEGFVGSYLTQTWRVKIITPEGTVITKTSGIEFLEDKPKISVPIADFDLIQAGRYYYQVTLTTGGANINSSVEHFDIDASLPEGLPFSVISSAFNYFPIFTSGGALTQSALWVNLGGNLEFLTGGGVFNGAVTVADDPYGITWDGSTQVPTKNAIYDKISSLSKTDIGLGNVDNTSDLNKPISTATQTALNLKASLSGATFTGAVSVPDDPYSGSWDGSNQVPTKNAIYDYIQSALSTGLYLTAPDKRTGIIPSSTPYGRVGVSFATYNNNNSGNWADAIILNTWTDDGGGSQNAILLSKLSFGARIFQAVPSAITASTSYRDFVLTENNPSTLYIPRYKQVSQGVTVESSDIWNPSQGQIRFLYDVSNYLNFTISSTGTVVMDAVGTGAGFTFQDAVKIASLTTGSVLFTGASGLITQNNANFFWDNTNIRLGIGANAPQAGLHVIKTTDQGRFGYDFSNYYTVNVGSTGRVEFNAVGTAPSFRFLNRIDVNGRMFITDTPGLDPTGIFGSNTPSLMVYRSNIAAGSTGAKIFLDGLPSSGTLGTTALDITTFGYGGYHKALNIHTAAMYFAGISPVAPLTILTEVLFGAWATGQSGIRISHQTDSSSKIWTSSAISFTGWSAPAGCEWAYGNYLIYADSSVKVTTDNSDWFLYVDADIPSYLKGSLGLGIASPTAKFEAYSTGEVMRLGYNSSTYFSTTVYSTGQVGFNTIGTGASFYFNNPVTARLIPRVSSITSSATPTPSAATTDVYVVSALATNATFGAPTGTAYDGQRMVLRIYDNGTARTLGWNAIYNPVNMTLPTTTVVGSYLYVVMSYNAANSKWDVLSATVGSGTGFDYTGFTTNGVVYFNGTSFTNGSALQFDGSKLSVGAGATPYRKLHVQEHSGNSVQARFQTEQYGETDRWTDLGTDYGTGGFVIAPNYYQGKTEIHSALKVGPIPYYLHDIIYGYNSASGWGGNFLKLEDTYSGYSFTVTGVGKVLINTSTTTGMLNIVPSTYTTPAIYVEEGTGGWVVDGLIRMKLGASSGSSFFTFLNSANAIVAKMTNIGALRLGENTTSGGDYIQISPGAGMNLNEEKAIRFSDYCRISATYSNTHFSSLGVGLKFYTGADLTNPALTIDGNKEVKFYVPPALLAGMTVQNSSAPILTLKGSGSTFTSGGENLYLQIGGTYPEAGAKAIAFSDSYNAQFSKIVGSQDGAGNSHISIFAQGPGTGYVFSSVPALRVWETGVGMGLTSMPAAQLHIIKTTEQLRVGYDTSNYLKTTVSSSGGVTFDAVGTGSAFNFSDPVTVTTTSGVPFTAFDNSTGTGSRAIAIFRSDDGYATNAERYIDYKQGTNVLNRRSTYFDGTGWGTKFYTYNGGLNSTPVLTLGRDNVSYFGSDIVLPNTRIHTLIRAVPNTAGDAVDIGNWALTNGGGIFDVYISVASGGFSSTKKYHISVKYAAVGGWTIVLPTYDSGGYSGNDFALDAVTIGASFYLRLRRVSGTQVSASANITIIRQGVETDVFTSSTTVNTVGAPTSYYPTYSNLYALGIGAPNPASGINLGYSPTVYNTMSTASDGTLVLSQVGGSNSAQGSIYVGTSGVFSPTAPMLSSSTGSLFFGSNTYFGTGSAPKSLALFSGGNISVQHPNGYQNAGFIGGTNYGMELGSVDGYSLLISSGSVGIGFNNSYPGSKLHVVSTTEQLRLGYNATNYISFVVDGNGTMVMTSVGSVKAIAVDSSTRFVAGGMNFIYNTGGAWIDMPTGGYSAIGDGGIGANVWVGKAQASGQFFTDASAGDNIYRNTGGKLLFGNTSGAADFSIASQKVGIGNSSPSAKLHVVSISEQLRIGYDGSNYYKVTVSSTGAVTFDAVGTAPSFTFADAITARLNPRVTSVASSATPTPNADTDDQYQLTALAAAAVFAAPTGTPVNAQRLTIRIKDDGTARGLSWNAIYRAVGIVLPTTTVVSKTLYVGLIYNSADSKWDVVSVAQE